MRETRHADELVAGTYIKYNGYTERVTFAQTVDRRTLLAFADNTHAQIAADDPIEIATEEEGRSHDADRDRERVANALNALAKTILNRSLPVPASLRDVRVDFNLDDSADLSGWSEVLRRTPVKHIPSLMPSMSSDELGVDVCITGGTWEFGPDLAERPTADWKNCARCGALMVLNPVELCSNCANELALKVAGEIDDVERRDAVGAFPVGGSGSDESKRAFFVEKLTEARDQLAETGDEKLFGVIRALETSLGQLDAGSGDKPKPAPVGWPLGDGHRPTPPADAMTQDRYDNGEQA